MAFPLFEMLSMDNPFESHARHLYKKGGGSKRNRDMRRSISSSAEHDYEFGFENDSKTIEKAEKAHEVEVKMVETVQTQVEKAVPNPEKTLKEKKESGDLSKEQKKQLTEAEEQWAAITKLKGKLSDKDYQALVYSYKLKYGKEVLLDKKTVDTIQKQSKEKIDLLEKARERAIKDHDKIKGNISSREVNKAILSFIKDADGNYLNVETGKIEPGIYTVDFTDPRSKKINWAAQKKIRTGDFLSAMNLDNVRVHKRSTNGETYDAFLHPDGDAYTVTKEKNPSEGYYVGIANGDKIIVSHESYPAESKKADLNSQIVEQIKEVTLDKQDAFDIERQRVDSETLAAALEFIKDKKQHSVQIPESVLEMSGADVERNLDGINMGDYAMIVCEKLLDDPQSKLDRKMSGTGLFVELHQKGVLPRISFNEITKTVRGSSSRKFLENYEAKKAEVAKLLGESGIDSKTPEEATAIKDLLDQIDADETFITLAYQLLKALPEMHWEQAEGSLMDVHGEKNETMKKTETLLEVIFPRNKIPKLEQGLMASLSRRHEKTANMDNMGQLVKHKKDYETMFTGDYANHEIWKEIVDFNGEVNLEKLATILNELQDKGVLLLKEREADAPKPKEFTSENVLDLENLSKESVELIQYGMMFKQMEKYTAEKERMMNHLPRDLEVMLSAIEEYYDLTPEEITEISQNIKLAENTFLYGFLKNGNLDAVIGQSYPVLTTEKGETITMSFGLNSVPGDDYLYLSRTFGFSLGAEYKRSFGARKQNSVELGMGASMQSGKVWEGANLKFEHKIGEEQLTALKLKAGAGINPEKSFMENMALASFGASLDVDYAKVLEKRSADSIEKQQKQIDDLANKAVEALSNEELNSLGLHPSQMTFLKLQLKEYFKNQIITEEIDDLNTLLPSSVGIRTISMPPYFLLEIGLTIKGKTRTIFAKPEGYEIDTDLIANNDLSGGSNFEIIEMPGDLTFKNTGETSFEYESNKSYDFHSNFEEVAAQLEESIGVRLEQPWKEHLRFQQYRIYPTQAEGRVEIFADGNTGIEVKTSVAGEPLVNIPKGVNLYVKKHVHVTPLPQGGVQEITRIYLTDNPSSTPEMIQRSSTSHIEGLMSVREPKNKEKNTWFEERDHQHESERITLTEAYKNDDIEAAQQLINEAFGTHNSEALSSDMRSKIKEAIEKADIKIDAKLQENSEDYRLALMESLNPISDELGLKTAPEKAYLIQEALIQDRSHFEKSLKNDKAKYEKFIKHINEWNQESIMQSLTKQGISDKMASSISAKISSAYAVEMHQTFNNIVKSNPDADNPDRLPETAIEASTIVQTHIGGHPEGNIMEYLNSAEHADALGGTEELSMESLMGGKFRLTEEEAEMMLEAFTEQVSSSNFDNFDQMLQHPIALELLKDGARLFGPETAKLLAERNPVVLEQFRLVMETLIEEPGTGIKAVEINGQPVLIKVEMQMGYLYRCRNFTTTYRAKRVMSDAGSQTETQDFLASSPGVKLRSFKVGAGLHDDIVPEIETEEPPQPEVDGNGTVGPGGEIGDIVNNPFGTQGGDSDVELEN